MRWVLVSDLEVGDGKRRCGMRSPGRAAIAAEPADAVSSRVATARMVGGEPHDAVKSRGGRARRLDREPSSAAKGERVARTPGEIRC